MVSICTSNLYFLCRNSPSLISHNLLLSPSSLSFSRCGGLRLCRCAAVKTGSEGGGIRSDNAELLRKPVVSAELETSSASEELVKEESDDEVGKKGGDGEGWVDWEDQILEDTVPLVGFVRMILHSGKDFLLLLHVSSQLEKTTVLYELVIKKGNLKCRENKQFQVHRIFSYSFSGKLKHGMKMNYVQSVHNLYAIGDRLSPDHQRTILQRLLPYHPECEKKIGPGVDYVTVGYHPDFESSRCLFLVRKDGESVDFSYWKCIKGLIRKNYPLYADSFILRHFRKRRRND